MTALLFCFLISWALFLLLVRMGRMPRGAQMPVAAALCLGLAAWAVSGRPMQPGFPARPPVENSFIGRGQDPLQSFVPRDGPAALWIGLASSQIRNGRSAEAVRTVTAGLRRQPRNADLWVAYGHALVAHADGRVTPAATLAFDRASGLEPENPAPVFFRGLALLQEGDSEGARTLWSALLANAPADAAWKDMVAAQLGQLEDGPQPSGG